MDRGSPDRIADLHDRALECAPEERRAFLENACHGDHALLEEVESLLQYESDAARFLEAPAAAAEGDLARTPDRSRMVGRQLGPYTIVAPLGAGGMGEVFRAHDSRLGRDVAIKILPSHFTADPERRSRFAREARLLATLNHPHIGAIYGLEDIDGMAALVLELVEGPTLADRLARGPLPIAEALAIARQLADALDAAHENGIVHRDLKPANIALQAATKASGPPSSDLHAKVLDFGLAKTIAVRLDSDLIQRPSGSGEDTADGRILGTPAYMSRAGAWPVSRQAHRHLGLWVRPLRDACRSPALWRRHDVGHVRQHSGTRARLGCAALLQDTRSHPNPARALPPEGSPEAAARYRRRANRARRWEHTTRVDQIRA